MAVWASRSAPARHRGDRRPPRHRHLPPRGPSREPPWRRGHGRPPPHGSRPPPTAGPWVGSVPAARWQRAWNRPGRDGSDRWRCIRTRPWRRRSRTWRCGGRWPHRRFRLPRYHGRRPAAVPGHPVAPDWGSRLERRRRAGHRAGACPSRHRHCPPAAGRGRAPARCLRPRLIHRYRRRRQWLRRRHHRCRPRRSSTTR